MLPSPSAAWARALLLSFALSACTTDAVLEPQPEDGADGRPDGRDEDGGDEDGRDEDGRPGDAENEDGEPGDAEDDGSDLPPWEPPEPPHTEPPTCGGYALACSLRSNDTCLSSLGCSLVGDCTGLAQSCYSQYYSWACNDVDGCYWSSFSENCSGSARSCSLYSSLGSCLGQPGCNWRDDCEGTADACETLPIEVCHYQPGCGSSCALGLALCDDLCTDVLDDEDNCGACGFDCGPRGSCDNGACSCGEPYTLCDGTCTDTDEDEDHCGGCGIRCGDGFLCDAGACVDIDECEVEGPCFDGRACTNTEGGFACGPCAAGYRTAGPLACEDIDECLTNNGGCAAAAPCYNEPGSFSCGDCPAGYTGTGTTTCRDIDECQTNHGDCDPRTTCTNVPGSRVCGSCPSGYYGDGESGCSDVDECAQGFCDWRTTCTNLEGSYACTACPSGYDGTGETGCYDIDECLTANGGCDPLRACQNFEGGVQCGSCASGYEVVGETGCADVNECTRGTASCSGLRACVNQAGSYACADCPSGYTSNGRFLCSDVNECLTSNGGCDARTRCSNTVGSRTCSACPAGFSGTGETGCLDIDECALPGSCDALARCENTVGGYLCGACPEGYVGSGYTCLPGLLGISAYGEARLVPDFVPHTTDYTLGWALEASDRRVRFDVAEGIRLFVNGVEVDAAQPVALDDGSVHISLRGANGLEQVYTFAVETTCYMSLSRTLVSITPNSQEFGRYQALSDDRAFALDGWLDPVTVITSARTGNAFGQVSTALPLERLDRSWSTSPLGMWDDLLVVGRPGSLPINAPPYPVSPGGTGSVLLHRSTPPFELVAELPSPGPQEFGTGFAAHGDLLAVRAAFNSTSRVVFIVRRTPSGYEVEAELAADDPTTAFGDALAWVDGLLAISDGRSVHLFAGVDGDWTLRNTLVAGGVFDHYGAQLAYDEASDTLYVSAPDADRGLGRVYVHRRASQPTPDLPDVILPKTPGTPENPSYFGAQLALADGVLAVTAPGGSRMTAEVVLYALGGERPSVCFSTQAPGSDGFGHAVTLRNGQLAVGASRQESGGMTEGAVHLFVRGPYNLHP